MGRSEDGKIERGWSADFRPLQRESLFGFLVTNMALTFAQLSGLKSALRRASRGSRGRAASVVSIRVGRPDSSPRRGETFIESAERNVFFDSAGRFGNMNLK